MKLYKIIVLLIFLVLVERGIVSTSAVSWDGESMVGLPSITRYPTASPTFMRGNISSVELTALVEFYKSLHGSNWYWKNSTYGEEWDVNNPLANPCTSRWQGVVCNCSYVHDSCTVSELNLANYGLEGILPSSFSNLSHLSVFNVSANSIVGALPEFWQPRRLVIFDVAENAMLGTIPSFLWSNMQLQQIRLHDNLFEGTISPLIGNLHDLEYLTLGVNTLTGELPTAIAQLKKLKVLEMKSNQLRGELLSINWSELLELRSVDLRNNLFRGFFPATLASLPKLVIFRIGNNFFKGALPDVSSLVLEEYGVGRNNFTGTIPNNLVNKPLLKLFDASLNGLRGTVPDLTIVTKLYSFRIANNSLIGTLPPGLFNQISLGILDLDYNSFNGTIPHSIGKLVNLRQFLADSNDFTGKLPIELFSLTQLRRLSVFGNKLTGTIPSAVDNLKSLNWITLSFNLLTGPIPNSFGSLANLSSLYLAGNLLNGTIPDTLGKLNKLEFLFLEHNLLTGPIPTNFNELNSLSALVLESNQLTGHPYDSFIGFPAIFYLILSNNFLYGPMPFNLDWRRVLFYTIGYNYFTGTIPFKRSQTAHMFSVDFGYNLLTGTLPKWLDEPSINYFYADYTFLHGSIPPLSTSLVELWCEGAQLTSTIPESISNCTSLEVLRLNFNRLVGTIPQSVAKLPNLQTLFLHHNFLTGKLDHVFVDPEPHSLVHIDMSNNQLTGTLPGTVFNSTSMQSFAASSNCFSGSVPAEICLATNLVALSLDGLATANTCRGDFKHIPEFKSFVLTKKFVGGIPACVFALPYLKSLHLSGNELTGSLASDLVIGPSLLNLSISNNKLSGSIPLAIQRRIFYNLDLSYNKFSGTLVDNIPYWPSNTSFFAQRNRLSGKVPNALLSSQNITILDGNLFSCGITNRDLPVHDPKYSTYNCGSNQVNLSLIVWVTLWPIFAGILYCTYFLVQRGIFASYRMQQALQNQQKTPPATLDVVESGGSHHRIIRTATGGVVVKKKKKKKKKLQTTHSALHSSANVTQSMSIVSNRSVSINQVEMANFASPEIRQSTASMNNDGSVWSSKQGTPEQDDVDSEEEDDENEMEEDNKKIGSMNQNGSIVGEEDRSVSVEIQQLYVSADIAPVAAPVSVWNVIHTFRDRARRWHAATIDHEAPAHQQDLLSSLHALRRVCAVLTACCIVLLLPVYTVLSFGYSSYQYVYIWSVSALIMRGITPAMVLMVIFCGMMLLTWILVQRERLTLFRTLEKDGQPSQLLFYFAFLLIDIVIMLMVNIAYIFAVERVGPSQLIFVESAVAITKVLWNEFVVIRCFKIMKRFFFVYVLGWQDSKTRNRSTLYDFVTQNALIILNLVVLPIAAIAFASTNCLYNLVSPPPTVDSGFEIQVCALSIPIGTTLLCASYIQSYKAIAYSPPFIYSNQCSSFIVINYSTVYIYFMIIVSFVLPLCKAWLKLWTDHLPPNSQLKQRLLRFLPRALHTPQPAPNHFMMDKPIFEERILPIRLISYLSLLLIFGVCFPPMALTVFVGIWIVIRFEELVIGKLLYEASSVGYHWYKERIRKENNDALRFVTNPVLLWFMLSSVSLIYAYLVFDVLTDTVEVKYHDAIAPVVFIVMFPSLIFLVQILWRYNEQQSHKV